MATFDPNAYMGQAGQATAQTLKPQKRALHKQGKALKQDFRTQKRAAAGASQVLRNAIDQAKGELQAQGLSGQTLADAMSELAAQKVDSYAWAKFGKQGAATDYQKARTDLQGQKQQALADAAKSQVSLATELAKTAHDDQQHQQDAAFQAGLSRQSTALSQAQQHHYHVKEAKLGAKLKAKAASATGGAASTPGRRNALIAAEQGYTNLLALQKNPGVDGRTGKPKTPPPLPKTDADWLLFAGDVASHADKADQTDAVWAVNEFRKKLNVQGAQATGQFLKSTFGFLGKK